MGQPFKTGYRDLQFNIELHGFVGELQLNLRRIVEVKARAHVYEVQRVLEAGETRARRAVEGFGRERAGPAPDDRRRRVDRRTLRVRRALRGGAGARAAAAASCRYVLFRGGRAGRRRGRVRNGVSTRTPRKLHRTGLRATVYFNRASRETHPERWTGGGGGGSYAAVANLPATAGRPDKEIKLRRGQLGGDLVVECC